MVANGGPLLLFPYAQINDVSIFAVDRLYLQKSGPDKKDNGPNAVGFLFLPTWRAEHGAAGSYNENGVANRPVFSTSSPPCIHRLDSTMCGYPGETIETNEYNRST
jgi:hypothetical protein